RAARSAGRTRMFMAETPAGPLAPLKEARNGAQRTAPGGWVEGIWALSACSSEQACTLATCPPFANTGGPYIVIEEDRNLRFGAGLPNQRKLFVTAALRKVLT